MIIIIWIIYEVALFLIAPKVLKLNRNTYYTLYMYAKKLKKKKTGRARQNQQRFEFQWDPHAAVSGFYFYFYLTQLLTRHTILFAVFNFNFFIIITRGRRSTSTHSTVLDS
jgi:hypothetical protein